MPELSPTVWILIIGVLLLVSCLFRMFGHPGEAKALNAVAGKRGWEFVSGISGGPAIRIAASGVEGDVRFREGKRRFLLKRHVRVRLPLGSAQQGLKLRIVPPMQRYGRSMQMLYSEPVTSRYADIEELYDLHATPSDLLHVVIDDATADTLLRLHPNLWLQVFNGRVEVRLAGEENERLIEKAIEIADRLRSRITSVPDA